MSTSMKRVTGTLADRVARWHLPPYGSLARVHVNPELSLFFRRITRFLVETKIEPFRGIGWHLPPLPPYAARSKNTVIAATNRAGENSLMGMRTGVRSLSLPHPGTDHSPRVRARAPRFLYREIDWRRKLNQHKGKTR